MQNKQIIKRNGGTVDFESSRIKDAIGKAILSTQKNLNHSLIIPDNFADEITNEIVLFLEEEFFSQGKVPSVENIQDLVEQTLVESGFFEIARSYILYRSEHAKLRAEKRIEELKKIEKNLFRVTKRDGKTQKFDIKKIQKVFTRVSKGYEKTCRFKDLYDLFKMTLVDKVKTKDLIHNLRKACIDLVSTENIDWQVIAGRLFAMEFYREACRNRNMKEEEIYTPQSFKDHFDDYIKKNLYYKKFYDYYSEADILKAGGFINKERDFSYIYSTMLAFSKRYLLNPNKVIHELPQEMYLAIALFLAIPEKKEDRLKVAKQIYEVTSTQKLSLPTPTLLNARTNYHQLSSCFKLNVGDDLRCIYHNIENMAQISKFGGGVGVYLGHIRSRGSAIRGVRSSSGGVIPWTRVINDTACAVNQLGARLGAISPTLDVWHRDINDFLNLQTESGDIRSKAFDVFPAISVPDIFMERVETDGNWTLFDPYEINKITGQKMEDLYGKKFKDFYEQCEQNNKIVLKETIKAKDLMKEILKTTVETGMPYFFFRDIVNEANPNKHKGMIYSTQLCTEICQNTSEAEFVAETNEDDEISIRYKAGETVVCNLASINVAKVNTQKDIDEVFPVAMRVLDNVITLNLYPIKEAELTSKKYRSIGLGFMGLAEYLACNKLAYDSEEARQKADELFEKYAYTTLRESNSLATERGAYELFPGSDWEKGILFGRKEDWYQKNSKMPEKWSKLIKDIKKDGLRFSYHLAPAPNTSTAGVVGTTAGLLPVYKKFFVETNVIAPTVTVAPNLSKENFWYYQEYPNINMNDVIEMIGRIYKWVDQSISFEWLINPAKVSPADLYSYYFKAWKNKIKTVYYLRSMSADVKEVCASCSG
ncbi:ribonucleoside-diphosphate reductase subunit alpha [Candidatus Gracilibacteria bacterium]|nr:ribonucleoside-diphosphate reductase subunit alpha [Candidatus Gracilibacteria bacterium]